LCSWGSHHLIAFLSKLGYVSGRQIFMVLVANRSLMREMKCHHPPNLWFGGTIFDGGYLPAAIGGMPSRAPSRKSGTCSVGSEKKCVANWLCYRPILTAILTLLRKGYCRHEPHLENLGHFSDGDFFADANGNLPSADGAESFSLHHSDFFESILYRMFPKESERFRVHLHKPGNDVPNFAWRAL
jgi:hypothetical protein